jgi:hypothetical protein
LHLTIGKTRSCQGHLFQNTFKTFFLSFFVLRDSRGREDFANVHHTQGAVVRLGA